MIQFDKITQYDFHLAYNQVATADKVHSGCQTAGIYPCQPDEFTKDDFLSATHHLLVVILDDEELNRPGTSADSQNRSSLKDSDTATHFQK